MARTFYATSLRTAAPRYLSVGSNPTTIFALPPAEPAPPFGSWSFPDYGAWLAHYTHQPYEECFVPPNGAATALLRFRKFFL